MTVIEVDIIFDFVCAWCCIGKRQLEMAISLYQKTYPGGKSDIFVINWRPYYLNYGPSTHSVDKKEVADIGRAVGINFKSGGKVGDTRLGHTLVRLSSTKEPEVQKSLIEGIFQAYHELEKDISTRGVLREIAIGSGIAAAEVDEWLNSEEQVKAVDAQAEKNKEFLAGAGVPAYTVQGERLDGQPDAEVFMAAFIQVKERGQGGN